MSDPITYTTALIATTLFCLHGEPTQNDKCSDGSEKTKQTISLLVNRGVENNIVEIEMNDVRVFTLHIDGTTTKTKDFDSDLAAKNFWLAMRRYAPEVFSLPK